MFVFEDRALPEKLGEFLYHLVVRRRMGEGRGLVIEVGGRRTFAEAMLCFNRLSITEMPICGVHVSALPMMLTMLRCAPLMTRPLAPAPLLLRQLALALTILEVLPHSQGLPPSVPPRTW